MAQLFSRGRVAKAPSEWAVRCQTTGSRARCGPNSFAFEQQQLPRSTGHRQTIRDSAMLDTLQYNLQLKIMDRIRSLGMHGVLPGFQGNVPMAMPELFPAANTSNGWPG
eukprot:SAG31_NODE_1830_length_7152_cov_2.148306_2_plen_109_part_00